MASIIVRGLEDSIKLLLMAQAQANGRSMEAEARDILIRGVRKPNIGLAIMCAAQEFGGEDLPIPQRHDVARSADFA